MQLAFDADQMILEGISNSLISPLHGMKGRFCIRPDHGGVKIIQNGVGGKFAVLEYEPSSLLAVTGLDHYGTFMPHKELLKALVFFRRLLELRREDGKK